MEFAWRAMPPELRQLLENVGAEGREVIGEPLGAYGARVLHSAGEPPLDPRVRSELDNAVGVWLPQVRLVVVDVGHGSFAQLDDASFEHALARVCWHEWAHALSVVRATETDIAAGPRLLDQAPEGIAAFVRAGGYRPRDVTHELLAETFATLMARAQRGQRGQRDQPSWLADEIFELMRRVVGWNR